MLAERVGFEPTIPVKVYTLSKRAPSATRPSLRVASYSTGCPKLGANTKVTKLKEKGTKYAAKLSNRSVSYVA